jgi:hypothetical protein
MIRLSTTSMSAMEAVSDANASVRAVGSPRPERSRGNMVSE